MRSLILLVISVVAQNANAQADYAKSAEIPPLRVSFSSIQAILDKTEALVVNANAAAKPRNEELVLKAGALKVTIPGRTLAPANAKVPEKIESLTYTYSMANQMPITRVNLDFSDYRRTLTVEGASPEQVDAIFAAVREDLTNISSAIGGSGIRFILEAPTFIVLMMALGWFGADWYSKRDARNLGIVVSLTLTLLLILLLPTNEILAGFLAFRGEPSLLIRYGPELSFIGLILTLVGLPLTFVQVFGPKRKKE